jgi:FtsZ-binding cell division protein ZapB
MLAQENKYIQEIDRLTEENENLKNENNDAVFKNRQLQSVLGKKQD